MDFGIRNSEFGLKKDLRIEGFEGLSEEDESVFPLDASDPAILDASTLRIAK